MAIISREKIVEGLVEILGKERVITDEQVLKESSLDRYRKYEQVFEVYTQPNSGSSCICNKHRGSFQSSFICK